jgi:hypothetical protein
MDIYFIQSVLNIAWYIFSVLFVLYRFTSFFTYVFGFIKFLGRMLQGLAYIKDQVIIFFERRQGQYINRPQTNSNDSFFTRCKKGFYYIFGYTSIPNEPPESVLPLYDTRTSYINGIYSSGNIRQQQNNQPRTSTASDFSRQGKEPKLNEQDKRLFDQHLTSVMQNSQTSELSSSFKSNWHHDGYFVNKPVKISKDSSSNLQNESFISVDLQGYSPLSAEEESSIQIESGVLPSKSQNININIPFKEEIVKHQKRMDSNILFNSSFIKKTLGSDRQDTPQETHQE